MNDRKTLAVLIDHLDPTVGGYAAQLRAAFDTECRKLDHNLLIAVGRSLDGPQGLQRAQNAVYKLIRDTSVDAVILVSGGLASFAGAARMQEFCESFKPLPLCSVGLELYGVPSIVIDPRPGLLDLMDHLVRVHACSRIAFVGGPAKNPEAEQRYQTYLECLDRYGLPFDEALVEHGPFTLMAGSDAALRLVARSPRPHAIVAANDALALGAVKSLTSSGLKVPQDIIVTGFDDLAFARFATPPLTTVRQPLARMAALAVRSVHNQLLGLSVSRRTELPVELTVRDSCGCGVREAEAPPISNRVVMHPADYLEAHASKIQGELGASVDIPEDVAPGWAENLIQALKLELSGDRGAFIGYLDELLGSIDADLQLYDELQKLVTQLREALAAVGSPALEEVWHRARRSISRANSQGHARLRQEMDLAYQHLLYTGERFASALDLARLKQVMAAELPAANVTDALVMIYSDAEHTQLEPLFCLRRGEPVEIEPVPYDARLLVPPNAPRSEQRTTAFVLPLTFGSESLGVAVFGARSGIHEMLRVQISVALKTAAMQRALDALSESEPRVPSPPVKGAARLKQLSGLLSAVSQDLARAAKELGEEVDES